MSARDCVKCGTYIPKGRFVCPKCKTKQPSISAQKYTKKMEWDGSIAGISLDASDLTLREEIIESLHDLTRQEAGTGWGKLAVILTGDSSDFMNAMLLKAIVDQNKILIRQNELILRALKPSMPKQEMEPKVDTSTVPDNPYLKKKGSTI